MDNCASATPAADAEGIEAQFRLFGTVAGRGQTVAFDMGLVFNDLCAAGTQEHGDAAKLFAPYAEAYNQAAGGGLEPNSSGYKSGLSTFKTFGAPHVVTVQADPRVGKLYRRLRELRDGLNSRTGIASLYQCAIRLNRQLVDQGRKDERALIKKLADADKRDAWLMAVIAGKPKAPAVKGDVARVERLQSDLKRIQKSEFPAEIAAQFEVVQEALNRLRTIMAEAAPAEG